MREMVERVSLSDKKEVYRVLIAARRVFASRPFDTFCLSWTLTPHVRRRLC